MSSVSRRSPSSDSPLHARLLEPSRRLEQPEARHTNLVLPTTQEKRMKSISQVALDVLGSPDLPQSPPSLTFSGTCHPPPLDGCIGPPPQEADDVAGVIARSSLDPREPSTGMEVVCAVGRGGLGLRPRILSTLAPVEPPTSTSASEAPQHDGIRENTPLNEGAAVLVAGGGGSSSRPRPPDSRVVHPAPEAPVPRSADEGKPTLTTGGGKAGPRLRPSTSLTERNMGDEMGWRASATRRPKAVAESDTSPRATRGSSSSIHFAEVPLLKSRDLPRLSLPSLSYDHRSATSTPAGTLRGGNALLPTLTEDLITPSVYPEAKLSQPSLHAQQDILSTRPGGYHVPLRTKISFPQSVSSLLLRSTTSSKHKRTRSTSSRQSVATSNTDGVHTPPTPDASLESWGEGRGESRGQRCSSPIVFSPPPRTSLESWGDWQDESHEEGRSSPTSPPDSAPLPLSSASEGETDDTSVYDDFPLVRREPLQGWSGEWNQRSMRDVISRLRALK